MTDLSDAHTEQPSLRGRKAIITGGTTGIGRAIAVLLASEGAEADIPAEKQREMIHEETMLRAEDIAVGVHYLLTQPRRAVIQQLVIAPRAQGKE